MISVFVFIGGILSIVVIGLCVVRHIERRMGL